jgi:hypothetical protein
MAWVVGAVDAGGRRFAHWQPPSSGLPDQLVDHGCVLAASDALLHTRAGPTPDTMPRRRAAGAWRSFCIA